MFAGQLLRVSLGILLTVFQPFNRLSKHLSAPRTWVKRYGLIAFEGNGDKVRKLRFAFGSVLALRAVTIIAGYNPQSNPSRQTAIASSWLGLRHLLMFSGDSPGSPLAISHSTIYSAMGFAAQ